MASLPPLPSSVLFLGHLILLDLTDLQYLILPVHILLVYSLGLCFKLLIPNCLLFIMNFTLLEFIILRYEEGVSIRSPPSGSNS